MASDLSGLDLLVIQIDGIHMDEDLILVAAIGVDAKGDKHPLGADSGEASLATHAVTMAVLTRLGGLRSFESTAPAAATLCGTAGFLGQI